MNKVTVTLDNGESVEINFNSSHQKKMPVFIDWEIEKKETDSTDVRKINDRSGKFEIATKKLDGHLSTALYYNQGLVGRFISTRVAKMFAETLLQWEVEGFNE